MVDDQLFSVLIVDDERATREGLQRIIAGGDLGLKVIGLAADGRAALQFLQVTQADIVLTDVRMPRMDGVGLATHLRQQGWRGEVIFLSGYSDREYLLSAIRLQAVAYVEKPVSLDELHEALQTARNRLFQRRQDEATGRRMLLARLLHGGDQHKATGPANLDADSGVSEADLVDTVVVVVHPHTGTQLRPDVARLLEARQDVLLADAHEENLLILCRQSAAEEVAASALEQCSSPGTCLHWVSGIGTPISGPDGIPISLARAKSAVALAFYRGWNSVYSYRDGSARTCDDSHFEIEEFQDALESDQLEVALDFVVDRTDTIRANWGTSEERVRDFYYRLFWAAKQVAHSRHIEPPRALEGVTLQGIHQGPTVDHIGDAVATMVSSLFLPAAGFGGSKRLVYEVQRYVRSSHSLRPTLAMAAERFAVSRSHLSRLFRAETGMRYTEFVKQIKCEEAFDLLRDVRLRISEVADYLGYDDRRYFSRIFREVTGMSPREYRERHL